MAFFFDLPCTYSCIAVPAPAHFALESMSYLHAALAYLLTWLPLPLDWNELGFMGSARIGTDRMERALLFYICSLRRHFFERRRRLLKHERSLGIAWTDYVHLAVTADYGVV